MFPSNSWTVQQLKNRCEQLGLKKTGKKDELIQRINDYSIQASSTANDDEAFDGLANAVGQIKLKKRYWEDMTVAELKAELALYKLKASGKKEDLIRTLNNWFNPSDSFDLRNLNKRRIRVMMVAEKPQMAKELARYLAPGGRYTDMKNDSLIHLMFTGDFQGLAAEFIVTSTFGHVYTQEFDDKSDIRPHEFEKLFDENVVNVVAEEGGRVVSGLKKLAADVDVLVLWLDCDLEGEAICFEVIDIVKNTMNQPPTGNIMDVIFRAKFSAAEDAPKAIQSLGKPNFYQNLANVAKHDLDLKIGVTFSRMQTSLLRRKFNGSRDIPHISFGPCQTPCFTFCVDRYLAIQEHRSEALFHVVVSLNVGGKSIEIKSNAIRRREEAVALYNNLMNLKSCNIASVERKDFVKDPPVGLNTHHLLMESSQHLGLGPKETMSVAERLYSTGLISYPRTETTKYPVDVRLSERKLAIKNNHPALAQEMEWESYPSSMVLAGGVDCGEHQPILPTTKKLYHDLDNNQKEVYDLICRHFMASFYPPHRYHINTVVFDLGHGLTFSRKIQVVDDPGYTVLLPWDRVAETEVDNMSMELGSAIKIKSVKMAEEKTQPPSPLTESELIAVMEKHRIGTDGSIPGHIENIQKRKYVQLQITDEKRELVPTELGLKLHAVYKLCVPELIKPTLRAAVEHQLMQIANGQKDYDEVYRYVLDEFKQQYKLFVGSFSEYCGSFEECFAVRARVDGQRQGYNPNHGNRIGRPAASRSQKPKRPEYRAPVQRPLEPVPFADVKPPPKRRHDDRCLELLSFDGLMEKKTRF